MSEEKKKYNFASGFYIYQKDFDNGGHILNVSGDYAQFTEWLKSITDEQGRFRMVIAEKRERVDRKPTHNCYEDTFRPSRGPARPQEARTTRGAGPIPEQDDDDTLPF